MAVVEISMVYVIKQAAGRAGRTTEINLSDIYEVMRCLWSVRHFGGGDDGGLETRGKA